MDLYGKKYSNNIQPECRCSNDYPRNLNNDSTFCVSNKDETNKEAVFFRDKDLYLTNYVCGVCYSNWKV